MDCVPLYEASVPKIPLLYQNQTVLTAEIQFLQKLQFIAHLEDKTRFLNFRQSFTATQKNQLLS